MNQVESDFFGRSPLESGMYLPPARKGLLVQDPIQQSDKDHRPYFSLSRLASSLTPDNNQPALSTDQCDLHKSILKSQLESDQCDFLPTRMWRISASVQKRSVYFPVTKSISFSSWILYLVHL